ncbi:MAG: hypothetical protein A2X52_06320 [Candidatus Rokubacteria bacterium GWC2_70_16]|nr:MAG: hypothetical protein A2X52_06320 [Candidatus Rokubacteria bacterium GWC2_70_16]OGL19178.1 MAG: hypothetical protein A3K12_15045 [Candidatus Rokubacteria bacterium RIFCSPLOWO2_12_FULL_71_19]
MARFLVVVPPDLPEVYDELTHELSGEDVGVIVDRRLGQRRERWVVTRPLERRCVERRGRPGHFPGASRPAEGSLPEAPR